MRIKMLRGAVGSPDGMNVYGYEKGETYTASAPLDLASHPLPVSGTLAALFVAEGWAEEVGAPTTPATEKAPEQPEPPAE
jgi:hypothetical protein